MRQCIAAFGLALISASAAADIDTIPSMFSFAAFGTMGVVHSDQDKADFTSAPFEAKGAGYTDPWSASVDSLIGAQVTAIFSTRLSAVVQVVSQQNYDAGYQPHVEWANLKYLVTPDLSVRIGRTALGVFLVTDSRNVGFANPWVRPPIELYGLVPVTSNDGLDASYRVTMGATRDTVQITAGHATYKYPVADSRVVYSADAHDQFLLTDSLERGFTTVRLTYGEARVSISELDGLFDGFREFGPQGIDLADQYAVDDRLVQFYGISASYEPGSWFAMAEVGHIRTHSVLGDKTAGYVSGGHRFGPITPYATAAEVRVNSHTSDPGLNLTNLPPSMIAEAEALNAGLNTVLASVASQRALTLGGRWDVTRGVDLKLQWDHIDLATGSQGALTNLQPGFERGSRLNVISAVVDFVF